MKAVPSEHSALGRITRFTGIDGRGVSFFGTREFGITSSVLGAASFPLVGSPLPP